MYNLRRERDGAGDCGTLSMAIWLENDEVRYEYAARPRVGVAMRVGSSFARTYHAQDWWQTTIITEILEENDHYVKFKTGNSTYEWWIPRSNEE